MTGLLGAPRKFKDGDRIMRVTPYHYAGEPTHDYRDQECRYGSVGVIETLYDDYDDDHTGHVYSVSWDKGNGSAINEECLDFETPVVTPDEEAAAIESILKGARHV